MSQRPTSLSLMAKGPHLLPVSGGAPIALERDQLTVGRMPDNDIQLDDPMVSRRHARLERRGPSLEVRDLKSANGTFVNERRIQGSAPARDGDTVRFGGTSFTVHGLQLPEVRQVAPQSGSLAALEAPGEPPVVLTRPQTVFGHAVTCDFVLTEPVIAPRHALIGRQNNEYYLVDLGSGLGTYVNGRRLAAPHILQPGDEIQLGRVTFYFRRG